MGEAGVVKVPLGRGLVQIDEALRIGKGERAKN
jgi:hypothetical protein